MPNTALPVDNLKIASDAKIAGATVLVILLMCLGFVASRRAQADPIPTVLTPQLTSEIVPAPLPRLISVVAPGPTPQPASAAPTVLMPQPTNGATPESSPRLISVVAPGPTPLLTSMATAAPTLGVVAPSPEQLVVTPPRGLNGLGRLAHVGRGVERNQLTRDAALLGAADMCPIALASTRRAGCNASFHTIVTPR